MRHCREAGSLGRGKSQLECRQTFADWAAAGRHDGRAAAGANDARELAQLGGSDLSFELRGQVPRDKKRIERNAEQRQRHSHNAILTLYPPHAANVAALTATLKHGTRTEPLTAALSLRCKKPRRFGASDSDDGSEVLGQFHRRGLDEILVQFGVDVGLQMLRKRRAQIA